SCLLKAGKTFFPLLRKSLNKEYFFAFVVIVKRRFLETDGMGNIVERGFAVAQLAEHRFSCFQYQLLFCLCLFAHFSLLLSFHGETSPCIKYREIIYTCNYCLIGTSTIPWWSSGNHST